MDYFYNVHFLCNFKKDKNIIFSYLILKFISIFIELRVTEDEEIQGLDNSLHGESSYNN